MSKGLIFSGLIIVAAFASQIVWYMRYVGVIGPEPIRPNRGLLFPFFVTPIVLLISFILFNEWEKMSKIRQWSLFCSLFIILLAASASPVISSCSSSLVSAHAVVGTSNHIAFVSLCDWEVYVSDVETGTVTRLTTNGLANNLSWAPDGRALVFANTDQIGIVNVYTRKITRLTNASERGNFMPAWSPDGKRIAFVSTRDNNWEIYTMKPDGSDVTRLTHWPGHFALPAWSPDSQRIAFTSFISGSEQIYVMNADGSNVVQLTLGPGDNTTPAWSPDGQRIAFSSKRDGNSNIYVMNADGSNVMQLTSTSSGFNTLPVWSPDGQQIAFVSDRDGKSQIYIMNADGSNVRQLTNTACESISPAWGPAAP